MGTKKWTETAIQQAFDNFISEYGKLPNNRKEMYGKYHGKFPRYQTIKRTTGLTLNEYLRQNYPIYFQQQKPPKMYEMMPDEYWIDDFKKQYIKYDYPAEVGYNKNREPKTPSTKTMARIIGVSTWNEVLNYYGFKRRRRKQCELNSELIFEQTLENYQILNEKLKSILFNKSKGTENK